MRSGHFDTVRILLENGANPNIRNMVRDDGTRNEDKRSKFIDQEKLTAYHEVLKMLSPAQLNEKPENTTCETMCVSDAERESALMSEENEKKSAKSSRELNFMNNWKSKDRPKTFKQVGQRVIRHLRMSVVCTMRQQQIEALRDLMEEYGAAA